VFVPVQPLSGPDIPECRASPSECSPDRLIRDSLYLWDAAFILFMLFHIDDQQLCFAFRELAGEFLNHDRCRFLQYMHQSASLQHKYRLIGIFGDK
jgi:hypothetical protein